MKKLKLSVRIKNSKKVSTGKLGYSESGRLHKTAKRMAATLVKD